MRSKVNDDLWILNFFEQWYTKQITIICTWLSERLDHSLHVFQCLCMSHIVKVISKTKNEEKKKGFFFFFTFTLVSSSLLFFTVDDIFVNVYMNFYIFILEIDILLRMMRKRKYYVTKPFQYHCFIFRKSMETLSFKESWKINWIQKHIKRLLHECKQKKQLVHSQWLATMPMSNIFNTFFLSINLILLKHLYKKPSYDNQQRYTFREIYIIFQFLNWHFSISFFTNNWQIKFQTFNLILIFRFGDGDDDDGASSVTASKPTKNPVLEKLGAEDGNISVAGVTNVVKDRVGNLLGKGIGGIGGLSTKFGGGSWF